MKNLSFMVLGVLVFSSAFADIGNIQGKIKGIEAAEKACLETAVNTTDMNSCSSDMHASSDRLLNEFYQDRVQMLRASAREEASLSEYERTSQETLNRLTTAQRTWIAFRDANCSLQSAQMLNGSGESQIYGGCISAMTLQRVKDLVNQFQIEN